MTQQYVFRVASATIEKFVPEVCDTITRAYQDQVMQCMNLKRWSSTIGSGREELWSRMPSGCWRLTLGFPEPAAAGTPGGQQGSHGLPGTAQPTEDQIPHSSTGRLWGGGPAYDSARGQ